MTQQPSSFTNGQLVSYMKELMKKQSDVGFTDRLKIVYRPYICPFNKLLERVSQDDHVFDIGCGSGQFAMLLAHFTQPKSVGGVEISDSLIENARQLISQEINTQFQFESYDGYTLPETIKEATKIFMIDVLHHIPKGKQYDFLSNVYQSMQQGAQLILKDIDGGSPFVIFNKMHDIVFSGEIGKELSSRKAIKILTSIGFKIIDRSKQRQYVYPHYTLVAEK